MSPALRDLRAASALTAAHCHATYGEAAMRALVASGWATLEGREVWTYYRITVAGRDLCDVCGAPGSRGHEHTLVALCDEHAAWWSEALTCRTDEWSWESDGEGGADLLRRAHDELLAEMREDHAASLVPVMQADPLDGLSLYGVGGAA